MTVKQWFLDVGEVAGRWMPKVIVLGYYIFFVKAWFYVVDWFMAFDWSSVENPSVALAIAGFPAAILGVITLVLNTLTATAFRAMNGRASSSPGSTSSGYRSELRLEDDGIRRG